MKKAAILKSKRVDSCSLLSASTSQLRGDSDMESKSKERLQIDFTSESLERLDLMRKQAQASTRAEVVRNALKLYEWFLNDVEPDSTIKVYDKDNELVSVFKARLLR